MFCERAADELVAVPGACLSIFSHPIDAATLVETPRHKHEPIWLRSVDRSTVDLACQRGRYAACGTRSGGVA